MSGLADSNATKRRKAMPNPWDIAGPFSSGHEASGLTDALRNLHRAEDRPPTEDDRPPASTFPMTEAARVALELDREASVRLNADKKRRTYGAA